MEERTCPICGNVFMAYPSRRMGAKCSRSCAGKHRCVLFEFKIVDDCLVLQNHIGPQGYGKVMVNRKSIFAHRFIYEEMFGPIPDGLIVRHTCDNPPCCNPEHLILGTLADNSKDMVLRNRNPRGVNKDRAKLTDEAVREIRLSGLSGRALAYKFGVCKRAIQFVRHRKTWGHVV